VELSFEKAAEYFEKAAILQFPPAQVGLAKKIV
jgi:TPR repeat protein